MRLVQMFGLAAAAALAVTAFVGASSASADPNNFVLCEEAKLECASPFPNPTTIVAHATNPKLLSSIGTVECEKSLIEITVLNQLATLVAGHILSRTLEGNCHLGATACTVTTNEVGGISILKLGPLRAHFKLVPLVLEGGSMVTKSTVKCGAFINCTYGGEPALEGTSAVGGETSLEANKVALTEGKGFLCPSTTELDVTYVILGPYWIES